MVCGPEMALPNFCVSMWLPNGARLIENDYSDAMAAQVRWRVKVHSSGSPETNALSTPAVFPMTYLQQYQSEVLGGKKESCNVDDVTTVRVSDKWGLHNFESTSTMHHFTRFPKWAADIVNSCHDPSIVRTTIHDPDVNICARTMRITEAAKSRPRHGNMLNCYL